MSSSPPSSVDVTPASVDAQPSADPAVVRDGTASGRAGGAATTPPDTAARTTRAPRAVEPSPVGAIDRAPAPLRKPVNTLAIAPKSARITALGRKSYNVLLHLAQTQGLEHDVFRAPLDRIIKGVDFDSNDHALIKKHLRAMVSTTVEWQSPTTGEGASWNVSGLLAHARLTKERGQVWVEWSYAVNLKQELLEPTVFARLKLEVISQLRSHAAIALYEICVRYRDVGRTARQHWRWWRPVLSGQPETERTARLEYRIFKRDTLKPAIAEVAAITDLDIELLEHKEGRFISDIQFLIRPKSTAVAAQRPAAEPVDVALVVRAQQLSVSEDRIEELVTEYGDDAVRSALELLAQRMASAYPAPLRDPYRYLRSLIPGEADRLKQQAESQREAAPLMAREQRVKRQARWVEEWLRRRRAEIVASIDALSAEAQQALIDGLEADMAERQIHPSIRKRLHASGWRHPLVLPEMLRYYAAGSIGDDWDQPTPEQLLEIAAEMGDTAG